MARKYGLFLKLYSDESAESVFAADAIDHTSARGIFVINT